MDLLIRVTTPDCDTYTRRVCGVPADLPPELLRWLAHGRIIDRNTADPLGCDPNDCDVEIALVPSSAHAAPAEPDLVVEPDQVVLPGASFTGEPVAITHGDDGDVELRVGYDTTTLADALTVITAWYSRPGSHGR